MMSNCISSVCLGSTITFALALAITTILHELAHALAGLAQGDRPVLYHTHVRHEAMPPFKRTVTTAAGPLFSLAQGIALAAIYHLFSDLSILTRLFFLWLALHGLVNFFGYLVITPFAPGADSGKIARYYNLSKTARFGLCAVGIAANWAIGLAAVHPFLGLAVASGTGITSNNSAQLIFEVAVLPWMIGAVVVILFRLPPPQLISVIYPALSGVFTIVSWKTAGRLPQPQGHFPAPNEINLWPWIIILAIVLFLSRFVLARGVRLTKSNST